MDWSNERYVRIYVRDTTTWKRLGFEGQSMFCLLMRKVDRTGILEIDDAPPWEAAMLHVNAPEEVARKGMERLLTCGVLEHHRDKLIVPNFIEAQEASMSPVLRQKEHRLRRRDETRAGLDSSQRETAIYFIQSEHGGEIKIGRADDVAKRLVGLQTSRPDKLVLLAAAPGSVAQERSLHDLFAEHRVKGEWFSPTDGLMRLIASVQRDGSAAFAVAIRSPSQSVTRHDSSVSGHGPLENGHGTSAVTLYRSVPSVPSLADPSRAAPLRSESARSELGIPLERVAADLSPDNPDQADPESALDQRGREFGDARKLVRLEFSRRWERAGQKGMWTQGGSPAVDTIANWALSLGPAEREAALLKALENFFADPFCRSIHFAVSHLAKDPGKYFEPRERPSQAPESVESLRAQSVSAVIAGDLAKAPPENTTGDRRGSGPRDVSASQVQTFDDAFRSAAFDREITPPSMGRDQRVRIVKRVSDHAALKRIPFEKACEAVIAQAFDDADATNGNVALALESCEPGKPKPARLKPGTGPPDRELSKPAQEAQALAEKLRANGKFF